MIARTCVFAVVFLLLCKVSVVEAARDDVRIVVNDNSVDSPQIGAYYAQRRGIDPANIVYLRVPDSYFIGWEDFRRLRDQLIRFMQVNTLDDPGLVLVVGHGPSPPGRTESLRDRRAGAARWRVSRGRWPRW